jgi:hypothetical protein
LALAAKRPVLVIDIDEPSSSATILEWLKTNRISTLNVAGPRESQHPGIHKKAYALLADALRE